MKPSQDNLCKQTTFSGELAADLSVLMSRRCGPLSPFLRHQRVRTLTHARKCTRPWYTRHSLHWSNTVMRQPWTLINVLCLSFLFLNSRSGRLGERVLELKHFASLSISFHYCKCIPLPTCLEIFDGLFKKQYHFISWAHSGRVLDPRSWGHRFKSR